LYGIQSGIFHIFTSQISNFMKIPRASRPTSDLSAIRTFLEQNPPGRIETALFSISGLQRRRRRTILWIRGVLLYFLFQYAESRGYTSLQEGIQAFAIAFYSALVLFTFVALQYEGKRIRKIARLTGKNSITVARVMRRKEVR